MNKKKRGRPKKIITEQPKVVKKRGRKPKNLVPAANSSKNEAPVATPAPKEKVILTPEELEERREKIRQTIPKIDLHRVRDVVNITKDKKACREHTSFSCHRPDIYLDLGCSECSLKDNCTCPIKDINRKPDGRMPKMKKFVTKPKISS